MLQCQWFDECHPAVSSMQLGLHERTQVLITFQHYRVAQRLVMHIQCWKQDQKYKTKTKTKTKAARPRPKL